LGTPSVPGTPPGDADVGARGCAARSGSARRRKEGPKLALLVEGNQVGVATDVHIADEDLRDRPLTVRLLYQPYAGSLVVGDVHLLERHPLRVQVCLCP